MESFIKVQPECVPNLIPILKSRLPGSAHILNMALSYSDFTQEMSFYTIRQEVIEKCWIIGKHEREDAGQQFTISPPTNVSADNIVRQAFQTTNAIDWDKSFEFVAVDRSVTHMISNISSDIAGNITEIVPCKYYYLDPEEAKNLVTLPVPEGVEVKTLNSKAGIGYLRDVWPAPNEKTIKFRTKTAQRLPSLGTFINGVGVSGAMVNPTGHIGIGTDEDYRGKGYAGICIQHLTKLLGQDTQLYPCAQAYIKNRPSHGPILRAGLKVTHMCDFIFYRGN